MGDLSDLGPPEDVVFAWPCRGIGPSEVALVKDANLVRLEGTDDGVHEPSIMEEYEVVIFHTNYS